jgi:hypothetical protein
MPNETVGQKIKELFPNKPFESISVEIIEVCQESHPPKSKTWIYGASASIRQEHTALYHDRTTLRTGSFDALAPVVICFSAELTERKGNLSPYYNDEGFSITRTYTTKVKFLSPPASDSL